MKQLEILNGRCLVVELPEGAHSPVVDDYLLGFNLPAPKWADDWSDDSYDTIKLPPGNWRIIGMLSEVTDAELADVTGFYYNKYNERYVEMPTSAMRATPIGDIEDAILAEGYYLDENPKRIKDHESFYDGDGRLKDEELYMIECEAEAEAQDRVLDRSRCLLLVRESKPL